MAFFSARKPSLTGFPHGTPGIGDGRRQFPEDEEQVGILGQMQSQPERPKSFWQGGDKFRWQDGLAGVLAAVGDAFAQQGGGQGGAVQNLTGGRLSAIEAARKAQQQAQEIAAARQRAEAAGFQGPQADMLAHGDAKPGDFRSPNNDTVADWEFYQQKLAPDEFERWKQNRIDPPQYRQGPDGQSYRIPPTTPPRISEDDWNSGQPVGGPSLSATGGFPRRR